MTFNASLEDGCSRESAAVNSSIHGGALTAAPYDHTVRFQQPYFLTFWPRKSNGSVLNGVSTANVRAEIMCLRTDDIEEGSPIPPSVQELLDKEGVKYVGNASGESSGSESGDESSALALKLTAPYLVAAAFAAMLFM